MDQPIDFEKVMAERFAQLPPSVQNAITSADVEQHLRDLAKTHQLHLDQWNLLENEVMLTLLGLQKTTELKDNIIKQVGVAEDVAQALASDIAQNVFQPIRTELEHQLENPAPTAAQVPAPGTPAQQPATNTQGQPAATPAPEAPATQAKRPDSSTLYPSNVPSHERRTIEGDPYREQIV